MLLHGGTDVVGDVLRVFAFAGVVQACDAGQGEVCGVGRQALVRGGFVEFDDVVPGSAAEDQQVEQRVGAQAVSAVHAHTRAFAHGVQAGDHFALVGRVLRDHLAVDVGGNAAHLVVDGRHHRDRLTGDVYVGKVVTNLQHRRQALHDGLGAQVGHVEVDVVLVRAAAAAFFDFLVHAAGNVVAWGQVFVGRGVTLHETLAVAVAQNGAFAAATFGQQHPGAMHAGGVELPELHVFERNAGACRHAQAVAGVDEGIGRGRKNTTRAAGGQQCGLGFKNMHVARFHLDGGHANHIALGVTDQVHGQPLHEEAGFFFDILLVQRVQHGVAGAVGSSAGALHSFFAVVGSVAAKRALVNRAVRVAVKRHAHVLEVIDDLGRFAAHVFNGVLVAEPVGAFDGVIEVVVPVVF